MILHCTALHCTMDKLDKIVDKNDEDGNKVLELYKDIKHRTVNYEKNIIKFNKYKFINIKFNSLEHVQNRVNKKEYSKMYLEITNPALNDKLIAQKNQKMLTHILKELNINLCLNLLLKIKTKINNILIYLSENKIKKITVDEDIHDKQSYENRHNVKYNKIIMKLCADISKYLPNCVKYYHAKLIITINGPDGKLFVHKNYPNSIVTFEMSKRSNIEYIRLPHNTIVISDNKTIFKFKNNALIIDKQCKKIDKFIIKNRKGCVYEYNI
jgi:hypothetical protein